MFWAENAPLGIQDLAKGGFPLCEFLLLKKDTADVAEVAQDVGIFVAKSFSVQIIDLPKIRFRVGKLALLGEANGQVGVKTSQ